jgi:hypothetical protein
MRVAIVVLAACVSPPSISAKDWQIVADFRAVDRVSVQAVLTAVHQYEHHLTDHWDASKRIERAAKTWNEMRARIEHLKLDDDKLDRLLQRYLEHRGLAIHHAARMLGLQDDEAVNAAAYHERDAEANEMLAVLDARLAKRRVHVAPAPPPDAGVVLQQPPPAPPGAAYFLVGDTVVVLDDAGFRVVATEIENMHVAENGVIWACSSWRAVKWDGETTTVIRPKIYNATCGVGADGTLWVFEPSLYGTGDRIGSFDGNQWKIVHADIDAGWRGAEQLVVTRDGTVYARTDRQILILENTEWRPVTPSTSPIEHIFRGHDGNAWVIEQTLSGAHDYPDALFMITPRGLAEPSFVDDHFQTSRLWANVDATGRATIFDARRNVIVQGTQTLRLPVPNTQSAYASRPGGFAYDAGGRLWVDLVDGLSVIDPDGTRHVFPIGSVDALRRPISEVHVIGAGPTLPTAGIDRARSRTISGTVKVAARTDIIMCVTASGDPPCGKGVKAWSERTDSEGRFTFENVPLFRFDLRARVLGTKHWRSLTGDCCDGEQTVLEFGIASEPQY